VIETTYDRTLEGSIASNSIERFLTGQADDTPAAKLVELMQKCMDTVIIEEMIVISVISHKSKE